MSSSGGEVETGSQEALRRQPDEDLSSIDRGTSDQVVEGKADETADERKEQQDEALRQQPDEDLPSIYRGTSDQVVEGKADETADERKELQVEAPRQQPDEDVSVSSTDRGISEQAADGKADEKCEEREEQQDEAGMDDATGADEKCEEREEQQDEAGMDDATGADEKCEEREEQQDEAGMDDATGAAETKLSQAMLMMTVSSLLEGKDLTTISMKEMRASMEKQLGLEEGGLDDRREEVLELVRAEVQRISSGEPVAAQKPSSNRTNAGKRKRTASTNTKDWRRLLQRYEDRAVKVEDPQSEVQQEQDASATGPLDESPTEKATSSTPSRTEFLQKSLPLSVQVAGQTLELPSKCFSSGSLGYYTCTKLQVTLDGVPREIQCQVSCSLLGSDKWSV
eukprot:TRINITY_DN497_c0_g1_i2.p1 TRINITY_DN497_c0_g1~~TRINITY_DN497_c0_g1_i2.p1  ORF type:complete len:419 (+),score=118.28 TRINITY_DN497_c0_g1_i2:68-1258(+)